MASVSMHTADELRAAGYTIENAEITNVSLHMRHPGYFTLDIALNGSGWGTVYGGYCLGKGYLGADEFKGSDKGVEAIMLIMNTVGVDDLFDLKGKYVRVATKGWDDTVSIVGNIIKDLWFDYKVFFKEARP